MIHELIEKGWSRMDSAELTKDYKAFADYVEKVRHHLYVLEKKTEGVLFNQIDLVHAINEYRAALTEEKDRVKALEDALERLK